MTDRAALLRSILAAPDDDAPRLVYADWLDDHGEPERAEFIRLQIKRARMNEQEMLCLGLIGPHTWEQSTRTNCRACKKLPAGLCEYHQCELRERQLFRSIAGGRDYDAFWLTGSPAWTHNLDRFEVEWRHERGWARLSVRRGFVEGVELPAADWLAHGDAILTEHPVQEVIYTTSPVGRADYIDVTTGKDKSRRHVHRHRWPGVRFYLPEVARGTTISRNVGTLKEPVWEPLRTIGEILAPTVTQQLTDSFADIGRNLRRMVEFSAGWAATEDARQQDTIRRFFGGMPNIDRPARRRRRTPTTRHPET